MRHMFASIATVAICVLLSACGNAGQGTHTASTTASKSTTVSTPPRSAEARVVTEFGQEASLADAQAITALVKRYYTAAAAADGATACSLIYSPLSESVAEDYGQAPAPASFAGKTCQVVMSKLFRQVPGQPSAVLASTQVTGVRVKERKGFALLRSKTMPEGDIPVVRELGTWRINTLIGVPLPGAPSPAPTSTGTSKSSPSHYDEPGTPKVKDAPDGDEDPGSNDDEPVIDFGQPASAADMKAISTLVKRFYAATSTADGRAICSLIYNVLAEEIPENYENSPGLKGRTCAEVIGKVFAPRRRQTIRELRKLKVTRVRVEGAKGLIIVSLGKRPEPYFLVHRQGTEWKMQRLFITTLP